jgi:hypothetical protein
MKLFFCLVLLTISMCSFSQGWTRAQLDKANTAKNILYLTKTEKDAIMYLNLCRLFPKEFADLEVRQYQMGNEYEDSVLAEFDEFKKSLLNDLLTRKACRALEFNRILYLDAKCYSTEISTVNRNGHDRINCKESNYAECISFGKKTGRDIVLQLLVDAGIQSLGHREICLDGAYTEIGISGNRHFEFEFCAVAELR